MAGWTRYDDNATGYAAARRTDPRWAHAITDALGDASSVVNVGAGTGSYEPPGRTAAGVDPSLPMLRARPPGAAPAVCATAETLPFRDDVPDAVLAVLTIHHWTDWRRGIAEMRRVARRRIVVVAADVFGEAATSFWLTREYFPDIARIDRASTQSMDELLAALAPARAKVLPVPHDCLDGFCGAFWRRPEAYLDPAVRRGISRFNQIDPQTIEHGAAQLARDLQSRVWHERHSDLLKLDEIDLGYRLVVAELSL